MSLAGLVRSLGIVLALSAVVAARWAATVNNVSPYFVGAMFGVAFLAIAWVGGMRIARVGVGSVMIGVVGSLVLVALALGASQLAGQPIRAVPKTEFALWAVVTTVVASAEELVLRGALFNALRDSAGLVVAVVVTSAAFALMHVPLYGWHVVPLDVGVGVFLAGLRLASGSVAAPAVAHVVADLATWWL
ncbi:MAG: CPBP family glutamic-type intramembrane protease [Candidatus Limnocylindrales bacterium]